MVTFAAPRAAAALALLCAGALSSACISVELTPSIVRDRAGPAFAHPVRRIVALPSTCGTLSSVAMATGDPSISIYVPREKCAAPALFAVDQLLRSNLELGGFNVIDSERVNAVTSARHEVQERRQYGSGVVTGTDTVERRGARFEDATPNEQRELLAELGAQGVLTTRISIGASVGAGQRRTVTVQLQLLEMPDRTLVWARRCEKEIGGLLDTDEIAMEGAARCASEGIRAR